MQSGGISRMPVVLRSPDKQDFREVVLTKVQVKGQVTANELCKQLCKEPAIALSENNYTEFVKKVNEVYSGISSTKIREKTTLVFSRGGVELADIEQDEDLEDLEPETFVMDL
jgi:hypothetical protein